MSREPIFIRELKLVSVAHIFLGLSFLLFIHLPRFLTEAGADEVGIGLFIGVAAVAPVTARPWAGRIMDTRGSRPVLVLGGMLNVVAITLYLTVTSLGPWLLTVRVLHGIAEGIMFTALFTYAADIVSASRRTEGLALFGVAGFVSMAVAGVLGDVVLDRAGFDELFIAAASVATLGWLMAAAAPRVSGPHRTRRKWSGVHVGG